MNRFVRNLIWLSLPAFFVIVGLTSAKAQVFDPNDGITTYNRNNPPAEPAFGQVGKWVRTRRLSWNTDSYKAYIYKGVPFRLKWPKNYDPSGNTKYPLFIFFHGQGEWGSKYDNEYQMYHGGQVHSAAVENGKFDGFLLYPQSDNSSDTWLSTKRSIVAELVQDFIIPELNINPLRISVDGLSAGGLAAWKFLQSYPKLVAACLPISSASSNGYRDIVIDNKFTPIWLFQGALDNNPKPASAQALRDISANAGGNFTYTEYPNLGHLCWDRAWAEPNYFNFMMQANKVNPWPLFGRTKFCYTGPNSINTMIGITAGFYVYQWKKNDVILNPNGTLNNTLTVTDIGTYSCRVKVSASSDWSEWSPVPVVITYEAGITPPSIKVSGLASRVLPAPDGKTTVDLEVPSGYSEYGWEKVGNPNTILSSGNILKGAAVGSYKVEVKEPYGCATAYTEPFAVIDANGPDRPDAATGLIAIPLSYTSIKLSWSGNPNPIHPQTHFEIYQATQSGGPYRFISMIPGNEYSFVREGLTPGVKYYYIVRAINNTAGAPVSNEASAVTQKDTNPPTAPGNLELTGTTRNYVSLAWVASIDDVGLDHYEIYINGVKSYVTSETDYTVYGLEYGKLYNFTVKAVDIAGNESASSNQVSAQPLAKGLNFKHYTGTWDVLPDFNLLSPISTGVVPNVTLENASQSENYGFLWEGFIRIPENGYYRFSTTSDDGSKLYLDPNSNHTASPYKHTASPIVNNDELHGTQTKESSTIQLNKGVYPIAITFFQQGGGAVMSIAWKRMANQYNNSTIWTGAIPDSAFVDPSLPLGGTAPAKPAGLTATAVSHRRINLNWTDNSNDEKSFELYRSTDSLNNFITVGVLPANTTSFADTLLEPATKYFYKIRAVNQYGESDFDKIGPGVDYAYYETPGNLQYLPNFDNMTPVKTGRIATFGLGMQMRNDNFALKFEGFINIAQSGNYTFYLQSDDGSRLYIDNALVVDYDGAHASNEKPGDPIYLSAGVHAIRVTYFEIGGNEALIVRYEGPGIAKQEIPGIVLGDILANATTLPAPPAPSAPDNLTAVGVSNSGIKVAWVNHAVDANGIELYRSYDGNEDYVLIATLPANTTFFNDEELYPSSLFYYKVRAVGEDGNSEYSNEKGARTLGIVPVVTPVEDVYMRYNSTVSLPIAATSGSPVVIDLQVTNLPAFATFSQTGNGKGTITFASTASSDAGVYEKITITATNPQGDFTTRQFNLIVNDNYVPKISPVPNTSVVVGGTKQVNLQAMDNDAADQLIWSYAGLPGFTSATASNRTAVLTFQPQNKNVGEYPIRVIVSDGKNGKDTTSFVLSVIGGTAPDPNDGTAPLSPKNATGVFVKDLNGVKLTWANAAYNAQKNEIYRSSSISGGYTLLDVVSNNDDSYVDYTTPGNTKLYYLVRAVNANGGANSVIIKVDIPNRAPVIRVEDVAMKGGNIKDLIISATDDPGDIISLNISRLPSFATFTDNGNGTGVLHLAPTGTHVGVYENIKITAGDQKGAMSNRTFKVIVTDKYINTVYVNFNNKDYPVSYKPWNSFSRVETGGTRVPAGAVLSNLKDESDSATSINVQLLERWGQIYNGVVTGDDSGIYPDSIMMSGYYYEMSASEQQRTIRISGLRNDKKYNLIFFASSKSGAAEMNYYSAGGQTASLLPKSNKSDTAQLKDLSPDQGKIDVSVRADLTKYVVISAMVIQEYDNSIVLPPYALNAKSYKDSINLSWKCEATYVTGFEVWRSDSPDGTYVKLPGTISGTTFNYTNTGLAPGTVYYYKVRAVSNSSYSELSDYISAGTIHYSVSIHFNDGSAANPPEPAPWNNTNELVTAGFTLNNLLNSSNQSSGIKMTIVDNFAGFNQNGVNTGNNSGVYSDNVLRCYFYVEYGMSARLMISGLNISMKYNFVFFGSRAGSVGTSQTGVYTIDEQTVTLNAKDNTKNTAQINNIKPDANGNVYIEIATDRPGGYGFLNSLVIQGVSDPDASNSPYSGRKKPTPGVLAIPTHSEENTEGLSQVGNNIAIQAYPNPFVEDIMLDVSLKKRVPKLMVLIKDLSGKPIYTTNLTDVPLGRSRHRLELKGGRLSPGVYGIQVISVQDGESRTIKVIRR